MHLLSSADFFSNLTFKNNSIRNTITMSNGLDPDQGQHSVGMSVLIWVQTVCIGCEQMTKITASKDAVRY